MKGFSLFREAKENYGRLIPSEQEGLMLLSLYCQFGENEFKEEDIIKAIETVNKGFGKPSFRHEYERNNRLILNWQDHFLWREDISSTYRFKSYGLAFCNRIHDHLKLSYDPTKIKRWFDELLNQLDSLTQEKPKDGFSFWISDHFNARRGLISQNVESLDEQVNRSVSHFKLQIKNCMEQYDFLTVFTDIERQLDDIKRQVSEMTVAFKATYDIDDILKGLVERSLIEKFEITDEEHIEKVRHFNRLVRSNLEQISSRIDKLQPRIRDFFSDFNRIEFDRKSVRFLDLLLRHSHFVKTKGKKQLFFPSDIELKPVSRTEIVPKFVVFPDNLSVQMSASPLGERSIDQDRQAKFISENTNAIQEKSRVKHWVSLVFWHLREQQSINFTRYFFDILKEEENGLSIAVKVSQKVLRTCNQREGVSVDISKVIVRDNDITGIKLWKIVISTNQIT